MTSTDEGFSLDDDVFTNTMCLFQRWDGSSRSSLSSSSRSSKSSATTDNGHIKSHQRRNYVPSDPEQNLKNVVESNRRDGSQQRHKRRILRDGSSSDITPTESNDGHICELCNSFKSKRYMSRCNSRFTKSSYCSNCSKNDMGRRHISYWGSPTYQRGSWRRRFRADKSIEIDLSPLLNVFERIDRMDTSMRIPTDMYTKHLPSQLDNEDNTLNNLDNDEIVSIDNEGNNLPVSQNSNGGRTLSKYSLERYMRETDDISHTSGTALESDCNGNDSFGIFNDNTDELIDNHCDDIEVGVNSNVSLDSEFENIVNDAINYNKQPLNNSVAENNIKCRRKSVRDKSQADLIQNRNLKVHMSTNVQNKHAKAEKNLVSVTDHSADSESEYLNTKKKNKRRLSRGALNLRAQGKCLEFKTEPSREVRKYQIDQENNKINKRNENRIFSISTYSLDSTSIMGQPVNNAKVFNEKPRSSRAVTEEIKSDEEGNKINPLPRSSTRLNLKETKTQKVGTTNAFKLDADKLVTMNSQIESNERPVNIDNVPNSYEEFNDSIENNDITRSSLTPPVCTIEITPTVDDAEIPSTARLFKRKSSVSQLTAFWEQRLTSGSVAMSDKSDSDSESDSSQQNCQYLQNPNFNNGKKKTVQDSVLMQDNAVSTETGTDEDEKFRRIQAKLENMSKNSSRQNIRRKSILKNKDITSSFLTEFLTVPSARTRNSDSESGSSSQQSIRPDQLAKRRVSFQSSVVKSSSSSKNSSSEGSDVDSNKANQSNINDNKNFVGNEQCGDIIKQETGCNMSNKERFKDKNIICSHTNCPEGTLENAENEHIVWRSDGTGPVLECNKSDSLKKGLHTNSNDIILTKQNSDENKATSFGHPVQRSQIQGLGKPLLAIKSPLTDQSLNGPSVKSTSPTTESALTPINHVFGNQRHTDGTENDSDRWRSTQGKWRPEIAEGYRNPNVQLNNNTLDKHDTCVNNDRHEATKLKSRLETDGSTRVKYIQNDTDKSSESATNKFNSPSSTNDSDVLARRRRPRKKLFSIAGEDDVDENTKLLHNPVELDSSDSSDIELSWRTRGYNADFYMSRKSITGAELINKFRQIALRKRSKDKDQTSRRKLIKSDRYSTDLLF